MVSSSVGLGIAEAIDAREMVVVVVGWVLRSLLFSGGRGSEAAEACRTRRVFAPAIFDVSLVDQPGEYFALRLSVFEK